MIRRMFSPLLVIAAVGAAVFAADLPSAWRSWRYSRAIESGHTNTLSYITLDREVFAHSDNRLADLRIINDLGQELPYEIRLLVTPPTEPVKHAALLRENSFVPRQFTQVIVDLGKSASFHNSLRVQTPELDFINWVEVAASDDAHVWRIVKPRAPISRFRRENLEGNQTIHYSENNARYLRLRIQEPTHQFPVTNVEVISSPAAEKEAVPGSSVHLTPMLSPDLTNRATPTLWTVDLGSAAIPVAELNFETSQPEFYRAVRILTSSNEEEWLPIGGGEIYRYSFGGKIEESLRVGCYETWGPRYWRVEVLNASDAPLSAVRLALAMSWRYMLFQPKESRTYRLIYGNARAAAPQYDLARTLQIQPNEVMLHLNLLDEELTSNYADPRPFTERHPHLLWSALGIAVALLAYAAIRAIRSPNSAAPQ